MAVYVSGSDLTLSTSALGWYKSEEVKMNAPAAQNYLNALSSQRYQELSFANNCNLIGVILYLSGSSGGGSLSLMNRSVIVTLQHYNGATWDDVTSVTKTIGDIISYSGGSATFMNGAYVYFEFSAPQAVTTAASTWRLAVSQGAGTNNWNVHYQNSAKTIMVRICVTDFATGKPGASDCAVIKDTVTMDENWTLGNQEDVSDYPISMIVVNGGMFQLVDPVVSALTLNMTGLLEVFGDGKFYAGVGSPVPAANQFTLTFTGPGAGKNFGIYQATLNYTGLGGGELKLYGEKPTTPFATLSANAANGQAVISVNGDISDWAAGKTVDILAGAGTTYAYIEHKVIQSVAGQDITLTTNLSYTHLANHAIVIRDSALYGIVISYTGTGTKNFNTLRGMATIVLSGVFVTGSVPVTLYTTSSQRAACVFDHCFFDYTVTFANIADPSFTNTFDTIIVYEQGAYKEGLSFTSCKNLTVTNIVVYDISSAGVTAFLLKLDSSMSLSFSNVFLSGIQLSCPAIYVLASTQCVLSTLNVSCAGYVLNVSGSTLITLTTVEADYIAVAGVYFGGNSVSNKITAMTMARNGGVAVANSFTANVFITDTIIDTPVGIASVDTAAQTAIAHPSMLSIHSYGGVGSDQHNNYLQAGNIVSTGDGLIDTTVHTSGSGKFALRFETLDDTNRLEWSFKVPTGNILGLTMTVAVWVKINAAAYYGGTHQKPRLTVDYDNGTEVYAEATASTDWQLLSVTFAPTTAYGQITVTLSTMTDQTGSDSYVYFDDMAVLYPAGYKLDLGGMDLWADALPITPPIATVLSAGDVWNLPASGLTGTGTIGQILNALVTGRYHYDKVGGIETIKDSSGNTVATFTVVDTATEVTKT